MAERKIIQIAVNDGGTTCLTDDDGRVWYYTTVSTMDADGYWQIFGAWQEIAGPFVENEPAVAPRAPQDREAE